jgi:uncharacterized protein
MIFEKSAIVRASPDRIWAMLLDPNVMGACVPGVEAIEVISDVEYLVSVHVKVAFISARFKVHTTIVEARGPSYLRSAGTGEDSTFTSSLSQSSEVFLTDTGDGSAELRMRLTVELMGKLGSFGLNIIKTKVDRMWQEFSQNLAHRLAEPVTEAGPITEVGASGSGAADPDIAAAPTPATHV